MALIPLILLITQMEQAFAAFKMALQRFES